MCRSTVLLPYKITLLSNLLSPVKICRKVLLPYKITLLSNLSFRLFLQAPVLLPYKITLLSNLPSPSIRANGSFTTL